MQFLGLLPALFSESQLFSPLLLRRWLFSATLSLSPLCVPMMGWTSLWEHHNLRAAQHISKGLNSTPWVCLMLSHMFLPRTWKQSRLEANRLSLEASAPQPARPAGSQHLSGLCPYISEAWNANKTSLTHHSSLTAGLQWPRKQWFRVQTQIWQRSSNWLNRLPGDTVPFCKPMLAVSEVEKPYGSDKATAVYFYHHKYREMQLQLKNLLKTFTTIFIPSPWTQHVSFSS